MHRKRAWDFHDYMDLRRARDRGEAPPGADALLRALEARLPVPFADALPAMREPLHVPERAYPRSLTAREVRFLFEVREEYARVGGTRRALAGRFDLNTEGAGIKDWLDFVEEERRSFKRVRVLLRTLDRKIYAAFTGERRMPEVPVDALPLPA